MMIKQSIRRLKSFIFSYLAWQHTGFFFKIYIHKSIIKNKYFRSKKSIGYNGEGLHYNKITNKEETIKHTSPKNILFAVHWLELGGAESYALKTIKIAHNQGHSCYVISTVPSQNSEIDSYRSYAIKVIDLSTISQPQKFNHHITQFIDDHNIEVLHIHHSSDMYRALPRIRQRYQDIKIVDTTHIVEYGNGGFPFLSAKYSDFIDVHNVISKNLVEMINSTYKKIFNRTINQEKFYLTYLSSLHNKGYDSTPDHAEKNKVDIIFYGRLVMQKLPFLFITIMEHYFSLNPNTESNAIIYGDGEMKQHVIKRLNKSKHKHKILFKGRNDNKEAVFKHAKILFICSLNEGISLAAYEAVAHNTIPLSTNVGAQSELIPSECLIEIDQKTIENAALKIDQIFNEKDLYKSILNKAKNRIKDFKNNEFNHQSIQTMYKEYP